MRTLVIGAGAIGGLMGACLARAKRDVTFLVRPGRAERLARDGLQVVSPEGDFTVPVATVQAGNVGGPYDLVIVGTKTYSLDQAIEAFSPAVGPATAILPILNGLAHIDRLAARFGVGSVLPGSALISSALDDDGRIVVKLPPIGVIFGEIPGGFSGRTRAIDALFDGVGLSVRASETVMQDMWEKFATIGLGAGMTCLMRSCVGDVLAAEGGRDAMLRLLAECWAVATAAGFPPRPAYTELAIRYYTTEGSLLKASMLRDIERGAATEGAQILGDLTARAHALGVTTPILDLARIHVAAYEVGRMREVAVN